MTTLWVLDADDSPCSTDFQRRSSCVSDIIVSLERRWLHYALCPVEFERTLGVNDRVILIENLPWWPCNSTGVYAATMSFAPILRLDAPESVEWRSRFIMLIIQRCCCCMAGCVYAQHRPRSRMRAEKQSHSGSNELLASYEEHTQSYILE